MQYLHQLNVVYRDLKPENLLLDTEGHLHLTDFGLSKVLDDPNEVMHTFCGTPYYLAPEMLIGKKGYNRMVDWWSLGILIFEMITGQPPFYSNNMQQVYEKIVGSEYSWPQNSSPSKTSVDLVTGLLQRDPARRLGTARGSNEVQEHPFFARMDWEGALHKRISTGFTPRQVRKFAVSVCQVSLNICVTGVFSRRPGT